MLITIAILIVAALATGITLAATRRPAEGADEESTATAVRRIALYGLLGIVVIVATSGVSGLLSLMVTGGMGDNTELARSLAFALVGGPVAIVLWRAIWTRMDERERSSVSWPLYLAALSTLSLAVGASTLLLGLASLVRGNGFGSSLATGAVWLSVWAWHWWMTTHPTKSPRRHRDLILVPGTAYGFLVTAGGLTATLTLLFGEMATRLTDVATVGVEDWGTAVAQSLVWAAGGLLVWWWHWIRHRGRETEGILRDLYLSLLAVLGSAAGLLAGVGATVYVGLSAALGAESTGDIAADILPGSIALGTVAAVGLSYHLGLLRATESTTWANTRLGLAGLGLVAATSGLGVVINSILSLFSTPLAESGRAELLAGGLAALAVGVPLWWVAWQPRVAAADGASTARRIYLLAVFAVAALVALVSLLIVTFRVFELILEPETAGGLVDRIRAPLGTLTATGLAAGYHYPLWRKARRREVAARPTHLILVVPAGAGPEVSGIAGELGFTSTVWQRSDVHALPEADHVRSALAGVDGGRSLVVVGPGERIEVIPLS